MRSSNESSKVINGDTSSRILTEMNLQPGSIKVAAYCRVSTLSDFQENSLENQIRHYTNYIRANPKWQFVGIYSDRGKTGTKVDGRYGFARLIRHCQQGNIDLILCKSVSRFARNVLDALDTVRKLKQINVRIIFEKEGIDTDSMQSEFILTLLAAVAQEESRSISENIKWGNTKRFERGIPKFTRMLGYKVNKDKTWVIEDDEAMIVKEAFHEFITGKALSDISRAFISKGYQKSNGRIDWSSGAVRSILQNERYTGNALCQKTYTQDHLTHKRKHNHGVKRQYLSINHHEAIIDKDTFIKVQEKMHKPIYSGGGSISKHPLTGRLLCNQCGGGFYRYSYSRGIVWRCRDNQKSAELCNMPCIHEKTIIKAAVMSFKKRYGLDDIRNDTSDHAIKGMKKDLQNADIVGDIEYNRLRLELEHALFEENFEFIKAAKNRAKIDDERKCALQSRRKKIEDRFYERERWWGLLESDSEYRTNSLEVLNELSKMKWPIDALNTKLNTNCINFLRGWVVHIKVVSPILFTFVWLDGKESNVNIEGS